MTLTRRAWLKSIGGTDQEYVRALAGGRGLEASNATGTGGEWQGPTPAMIRLDSNENPLGPGRKAIEALTGGFGQAMRYPYSARPSEPDLREQIAKSLGASVDNVVPGAGSTEILRNVVRAFTSPTAHLVTVMPTFTLCEDLCRRLGHPVKSVGVDTALRIDLDALIDASRGAGLVFFGNPNNPTGTAHGQAAVADMVERIARSSPDTKILVDEAYHDYATSAAYASAVPLALARPNVIVSRTFSKAYGMAGLRLGYGVGQVETITALAKYRLPNNTNVLALAAALASIQDPAHIAEERARNTQVRAFVSEFFTKLGHKPAESDANFLFVPIGRPARAFREACAREGIQVGRDFPPFERTHARISIGTMDEMRKATPVFARVLSALAPSLQQG